MKKFLFVAIVLPTLFACKKENSLKNTQEILETVEDNSLMESEFAAIFNVADEVGRNETNKNASPSKTLKGPTQTHIPNCAETSFDTTTNIFTIHYLDSAKGCLCKDGLRRKGKIHISFSGKYLQSGSFLSALFEDYYVSNIKFNGRKTITNLGNGSGNYRFKYEVDSASAITPSGTITWETDATIEKIAGEDTPFNPFDDEFKVTGASRGVTRKGISYIAQTTIPLIKRNTFSFSCLKHYVSGVIRVEDANSNFMEIDYDPDRENQCDRKASVNINNQLQREIMLR